MSTYDLNELLNINDITAHNLGEGSLRALESAPSRVHLLANWGYAYKNKIVVGKGVNESATTGKIYYPFGSISMYPYAVRADKDPTAPRVLISTTSGSQTSVASATDVQVYYCYAIEIVLQGVNPKVIQFKDTGTNYTTYDFYSGSGAFTMAYNSRSETTAEYALEAKKAFPTYEGANVSNESEHVTLQYIYTYAELIGGGDATNPVTGLLEKFWNLKMYLKSLENKDFFLLVYDSNIFISATGSTMNKDIASGGLGGIISGQDFVISNNQDLAGIVTDIQLIPEGMETELYKTIDVSSGSNYGNTSAKRRSAFLEEYAFKPDSLANYIIPINSNNMGTYTGKSGITLPIDLIGINKV